MLKLNVLLAKTDHLAASYKKNLEDFLKFFKDKQGAFRGEKKTYAAREGTIDLPTERKNDLVTTTVGEKLQWLKETNKDYIDSLFAQEATNASGTVKAKLTVDGKEWGEFSALELLRLKGLLESGMLEEMYKNIPVRSDSEEWTPTIAEQYKDKDIYESPKMEGIKKSTTKEHFILPDPNIQAAIAAGKPINYQPQMGQKDTIVELGDYTYQKFSGEFSHLQRANILKRRTKLLSAVIEALKIANEAEAVESKITSERIFDYLHEGK